MKKILFTCIISLCAATVQTIAQEPNTRLNNKQKVDADLVYQEAKNQKARAKILLLTGLGIAATGGVVQLIHENQRAGGWNLDFTGAGIAITGGIISLTSIPVFISSSNNKTKADLILKDEKVFFTPHLNKKEHLVSLGVKINL